jgi:hypothetical protein
VLIPQECAALAVIGKPLRIGLNDDGDRLHAEAFRDLEPGICDCTTMAKIAAHIALSANTADCELVFAVAHVSEMLDAFKAQYYAAYHGEKWRDAAP